MKTEEAASCPDSALVQRMAQDDAGAFEQVYHKYAAALFHVAHNILRNREVCEDIIQELFIELWCKRRQLHIRHLRSYLYTAIKNNVLMAIRSGRATVDIEELEQLVEGRSAADRVLEKELLQTIDYNVAQLPVKCRTIFLLSREERLSRKEIASQLNISAKTVENQMTIALRKLKSSLESFRSFFF